MTIKYNLQFAKPAEKDMEDVFEYIYLTLSAPEAAKNLMHKMENQISCLSDFPYANELCRDDILAENGYRRLVVDNYIVIYSVDEYKKTVFIVRVFYGKRNYAKYVR